jgi:hypothetical protein
VGAKSWTLAGVIAVLLPVGPGAPTATAQVWSAPTTLSQDGGPVAGDIDIDADGTVIAAWTGSGGPVRAAVREAGGSFGSTVTLAADGGQAVSVALDGGGALVAW